MDRTILFRLLCGLVASRCAISARPNVDFETRSLDESHVQARQLSQLHAASLSQHMLTNGTPSTASTSTGVVWDSNEDVETDDNFHTDVGTKLEDVGKVVDAVEDTAKAHANYTDSASEQLSNGKTELIKVEKEFATLTHDVKGWDHDVIQDFKNAEKTRMAPFDAAQPIAIEGLAHSVASSSHASAHSVASSSHASGAEAPKYAKIEKQGIHDCQDELKYFAIANEKSCRAAASDLGFDFDQAVNIHDKPPGCFTGSANKVTFNSDATGTGGSLSDEATIICSAKDEGQGSSIGSGVLNSIKSFGGFFSGRPSPTPRPTTQASEGLV